MPVHSEFGKLGKFESNLPVSRTNVSTIVGWNTSTIDDDTKNHEAHASSDLDHADDKLNLAIATDPKVLNGNKCDEDGYDPSAVVDAL